MGEGWVLLHVDFISGYLAVGGEPNRPLCRMGTLEPDSRHLAILNLLGNSTRFLGSVTVWTFLKQACRFPQPPRPVAYHAFKIKLVMPPAQRRSGSCTEVPSIKAQGS